MIKQYGVARDQIAGIITTAAQSHILPYFQRLQPGQINDKGTADLVSVADLETEAYLSNALQAALPGSVIVGEETAAADAQCLQLLHGSAPVWVIEPVDGTNNFVAGLPIFAVMVALVHDGVTQAGWVYDPVHQQMAIAVRDEGCWMNGQAMHLAPPASLAEMTTGLHFAQAEPDLRKRIAGNLHKCAGQLLLYCAGIQYFSLLLGRTHVASYGRAKVWDHAPGILLVQEAGGFAAYGNGEIYTPLDSAWASRDKGPLIIAAGRKAWDLVHQELF